MKEHQDQVPLTLRPSENQLCTVLHSSEIMRRNLDRKSVV